MRSGDFEVDVPAREAAFSMGVLSSGQSAPPLHPGMVSLHEGQTTLEAGGMNRRSQPSSSADELGRFGALKDEPRPIKSCVTERNGSIHATHAPRRVPAPPQIIRTQARLVPATPPCEQRAKHTDSRRATHITPCRNLRGNRSVEFCKLRKTSPYQLPSQS